MGGEERRGSRGKPNDGGRKKGGASPNAFVSIRIRSSCIRLKMEEVQVAMRMREPKVTSSLVPLDKLHVTMLVTSLRGNQQIERYVCVCA